MDPCQRAEELLEKGEYDDVIAETTERLRLAPDAAEAYVLRGLAFYYKGEFDRAIADSNEAMRRKPLARAVRCRCICFVMTGDYARAVADGEEAIRLEPENVKGYYLRGLALENAGDLDRALADYNEVLRRDPDHSAAYQQRGRVHLHQQDHEKALADFNEALRLQPEESRSYLLRAIALHHADEYEAALADYGEAIRRQPTDATAYEYRGRLHYKREEYDRALADLHEAVRLAPRNPEPLRWRGWAFLKAEQFEKAVADFTAAIELDPASTESHQGRGKAWVALGDLERAEADFALARTEDQEEIADMTEKKMLVHTLLQRHFEPIPLDDLVVTQRCFPYRIRPDLQRALDGLLGQMKLCHFCAPRYAYAGIPPGLSELLVRTPENPITAGAAEYEDLDVGEEEPVRCLKSGLWLLEGDGVKLALLLQHPQNSVSGFGIPFQVLATNDEAGTRATRQIFKHLEEIVRQAPSYRGKILSLEWSPHYGGMGSGIKVHKLHPIGRDDVILPRQTLTLLERNVIQFIRQRERLAKDGLATRKGVLFYGPPGTGKTYTLHYLVGELKGVTTFLMAAEQMMGLSEYMTLARLLQPSLVVIEDADLIARDRAVMGPMGCDAILLNQLLNEMDGLREDADVLFILTTNRPEVLESALTARPGRIDQAIEFPYPDEEGRAKLVRLYARGVPVSEEVVGAAVKRTEKVSAAFIKELMRRAAQFRLERGGDGGLTATDLENALDEILFRGGSLNRKLLGSASLGFGTMMEQE